MSRSLLRWRHQRRRLGLASAMPLQCPHEKTHDNHYRFGCDPRPRCLLRMGPRRASHYRLHRREVSHAATGRAPTASASRNDCRASGTIPAATAGRSSGPANWHSRRRTGWTRSNRSNGTRITAGRRINSDIRPGRKPASCSAWKVLKCTWATAKRRQPKSTPNAISNWLVRLHGKSDKILNRVGG